MVFEAIAFTTLAIWIYVICARGGFWLEPLRHVPDVPAPARWPSVTAVVPARDEAACVADSVRSLLLQNYPGALSVVLVDDNSADGTGKIAKAEAAKLDQTGRLAVVSGRPLESGWTGKMWALRQGVEHAERSQPDYILFTDADIVHDADTIAWLVARAEAGQKRSHLPDGEFALREFCRKGLRARLHLFLPDALSLRLGEPAARRDGRGGRRLHVVRRTRCAAPAASIASATR